MGPPFIEAMVVVAKKNGGSVNATGAVKIEG